MMSKDWVQRLGFLLGAFLLVGVVCIKNGKKIDNLPKIELLTKENAYLIEEETQGVYEISSKEISYTAIWGNQYNEFIPPNDMSSKGSRLRRVSLFPFSRLHLLRPTRCASIP